MYLTEFYIQVVWLSYLLYFVNILLIVVKLLNGAEKTVYLNDVWKVIYNMVILYVRKNVNIKRNKL